MALPDSRNTTYVVDAEVKSVDLNALQDEIIKHHGWANVDLVGATANNARFSFSDRSPVERSTGFSISGDELTVPAPGTYEVQLDFYAESSDTANPKQLSAAVTLAGGGPAAAVAHGTRFSATAAHGVLVGGGKGIFVITDPATQKIRVTNTSNTGNVTPQAGGLLVRRVG
jgi:hypothetical protein